ncbi:MULTISPECIES: PRC-barrel domain-containing protein [Bacillaceae]|uniref:PRC-barrel domain-containing protein n=1 Tax=Evansella alkalicola TaxID=745819 RepID=A0ABS6JQF4_9BACI|nr:MULTISPECIES: PRC-barrel domain-containing protein [Bacillaceae]MBU9720670.1 PRC-barrel domain-containing protein [Bacillus alkalicola]
MRSLKKVKGTPVFFEKKNKYIGKITDLILTEREAAVQGYWVHDHRWWSKKHFLPLDKIADEDGNGVYVKEGTTLKTVYKFNKRFVDGSGHSFGKTLREKDGSIIGIIEDVYFLPDSGKIVGYEISEGLFSDLKHGIKVFKPQSPLIETEESFVVK